LSHEPRHTRFVIAAHDDDTRRRQFHIIGQTGTGKTTLIKHMVAQDLAAGSGVAHRNAPIISAHLGLKADVDVSGLGYRTIEPEQLQRKTQSACRRCLRTRNMTHDAKPT
jgi:GTP-binding protein EngB required for normal cell division